MRPRASWAAARADGRVQAMPGEPGRVTTLAAGALEAEPERLQT